ncbi:MAG: A24 family peptidase [Candidatus Pacearchaeota archaeon]
MIELIFIIVLCYLFLASLIDLKKKEVPDWLSFSLLFITLSYAILNSLNNFNFLFANAIVFLIFFIIANGLYYGKVFGGGDFKLLLAIAPAINIFFPRFLANTLIIAGAYGFVWALAIFFKNIKRATKEVRKKELNKNFFIVFFFSFLLFLFFFFTYFIQKINLFLVISIFFLLFPWLYLIIKISDKILIVAKKPEELVEGDLLAQEIKIKDRLINGIIGSEEIKIIKKHGKKVLIKDGIPFVPVFFLSFLITPSINLLLTMVYALL